MKFIALETEKPNATAEEYAPQLKDEARHVWEDFARARELTSAFPLVRQGLISFDIIPLVPYSGYSRLFG
jgi:hypothetical protein